MQAGRLSRLQTSVSPHEVSEWEGGGHIRSRTPYANIEATRLVVLLDTHSSSTDSGKGLGQPWSGRKHRCLSKGGQQRSVEDSQRRGDSARDRDQAPIRE